MLSDCGCIYVAFGRPYLVQALNSLRSLRRYSPDIPVCILTNVKAGPPEEFEPWNAAADVWLHVDAADDKNRYYKTDLPRYTPFSRTLFLDCDTEILTDITPIFAFLDYWDIALCLKAEGYMPLKEKGRQIVLDGSAAVFELPHWNSGVMLFAGNQRVSDFFQLWSQFYKSGATKYDQVSLVEALFRCSARILSLDARWNGGRNWGASRPDQRRYVLHYMHDIDDELAENLMRIDLEVFGHEPKNGATFGARTESFLRKRQIAHLQKKGRKWQARWLRLLYRIKRRLGRAAAKLW